MLLWLRSILWYWELVVKSNSFGREVDQSMLMWFGRVFLHKCWFWCSVEHNFEDCQLKEKELVCYAMIWNLIVLEKVIFLKERLWKRVRFWIVRYSLSSYLNYVFMTDAKHKLSCFLLVCVILLGQDKERKWSFWAYEWLRLWLMWCLVANCRVGRI